MIPLPSPEARRRLGLVLVTLSAVAWSTAGFFTRLVPLDAPTILFWRGVFGAGTGLLFMLAERRGDVQGLARAFLGMGRTGLAFSLASTIGMVAFLEALKRTTVADVAIVYGTVPFFAAGLAWLLLRERTAVSTLVGSLAAALGVLIALGNGAGSGDGVGNLLAVVMTAMMAAIIVASRAARSSVPMVPGAVLSALLGSLICLPFASPQAATPPALLELAVFGASNMGLGLILFVIGARLVPAGETALIGTIETPLAPFWVWLAFGERPNAATILGGVIVVAAVVGHLLVERRAKF